MVTDRADALPPPFVQRMRTLLGGEADAFFAAIMAEEQRGLRVNLLKLDASEWEQRSPWLVENVPWCSSGYYLPPEARPGKHPYHAAGLFYVQEPSAMAVVEALDVRPGQRVLDLAAAPGGKATQIAALLGGSGVLLANEIERSRVKALGENLERWGVRNVVLTHETPERLADTLGPIFDRVLLDAPCSGEGMFRKSVTARLEWSAEHVVGCALRQANILLTAARLVRPGGRLVYSTCTFAPEENEQRIAEFVGGHGAWAIDDILRQPEMSDGHPEWAAPRLPELARAVRLWPHKSRGEGHFIAVLENRAAKGAAIPSEPVPERGHEVRRRSHDRRNQPAPLDRPSDGAMEAWKGFELQALRVTLPRERIFSHGGQLYLRAAETPRLDGLRIVRPGLWLGEAKPGRFEPAHALALALAGADAANSVTLDVEAAGRYLHGETIAADGPPGWVLVTLERWPIGWGRRAGSVVKNFYPKGLRWPG